MAMSESSARPRWLVAVGEYDGLTPYIGGIGRRYAALVPALVDQGIDVDLMILRADALPKPKGLPAGLRVIISPSRRPARGRLRRIRNSRRFQTVTNHWRLRQLVNAVRVRRQAGRHPYDVVLIPEWEGAGGLLPRSVPLVTNLVTSLELIHQVENFTLPPLRSADGLQRRIQLWLESRQTRKARAVVAGTQAVLSWNIAEFGTLPPAALVRNCTNIDRIRAAARDTRLPAGWPTDPDSQIVLFAGRLETRKGIETALRAFNSFGVASPKAQFVLAGGVIIPLDQLMALVDPELRHRVTSLGQLDSLSVYAAMRHADVVMTPSLWEAFSNASLEVRAVGTPLIATSGSGFDDFCVDGVDSLLVAPGNEAELADAVTRLLHDRHLADSLVANGTDNISSYAPSAVAPDMIATISGLLAR